MIDLSPGHSLYVLLFGLLALTPLSCVDDQRSEAQLNTSICDGAGGGRGLEDALLVSRPLCRAQLVTEALNRLGENGVSSVEAFMQTNHVLLDDSSLALILRWQTEIEPDRTLERALEFAHNRRGFATRMVLERWAEIDSTAAEAALDAIPQKERPEGAAIAIARGWEASGAPGLDGFISHGHTTKRQRLILREVLSRIAARSGSDAMIRWVESVASDPAHDFRLLAHRQAAGTLSRTDPQTAIDWLARVEDTTYHAPMSRAIATQWVLDDASAAMAWVGLLAPGRDRDRTVRETYRALSRKDDKAAIDWFDGFDYGDWLEPALTFHLGALAHHDAPSAISQIDRIQDPSQRRRATLTIVRQWRVQDAEAAEAWLDNVDLPADLREQLDSRRRKGANSNAAPRDD